MALHWSVKHSNLEMAEMVAKAGIDVDAKSVSDDRCLTGFSELVSKGSIFTCNSETGLGCDAWGWLQMAFLHESLVVQAYACLYRRMLGRI